jgi:flagellar motor protein MotB
MPKPVKAKAASPQPPKEAKQKVEDFVFSEVSLKNLINKDLINKEKTTVDKPIEDKRPNLAKIQKKQEAEAKQKQALEERAQKRKETELAAAVKKKQAAEQRKAATEDRADAQEKRAADLRAKRAESIVDKAKPGATISLGFFGFGQQKDDEDSKSVTGAPAGVPTLSNWVQDVDGSIIGSISGSTSFRTGESITTSSITTRDPSADSVVQTKSGSRYVVYF